MGVVRKIKAVTPMASRPSHAHNSKILVAIRMALCQARRSFQNAASATATMIVQFPSVTGSRNSDAPRFTSMPSPSSRPEGRCELRKRLSSPAQNWSSENRTCGYVVISDLEKISETGRKKQLPNRENEQQKLEEDQEPDKRFPPYVETQCRKGRNKQYIARDLGIERSSAQREHEEEQHRQPAENQPARCPIRPRRHRNSDRANDNRRLDKRNNIASNAEEMGIGNGKERIECNGHAAQRDRTQIRQSPIGNSIPATNSSRRLRERVLPDLRKNSSRLLFRPSVIFSPMHC